MEKGKLTMGCEVLWDRGNCLPGKIIRSLGDACFVLFCFLKRIFKSLASAFSLHKCSVDFQQCVAHWSGMSFLTEMQCRAVLLPSSLPPSPASKPASTGHHSQHLCSQEQDLTVSTCQISPLKDPLSCPVLRASPGMQGNFLYELLPHTLSPRPVLECCK